VELAVPPLRRRRSDIAFLAHHFLGLAAPGATITLSPNALQSLLLHEWPMNVRELKAVCDRLALAFPDGGHVKTADVARALPVRLSAERAPAPVAATNAPGRDELAELLRGHGGNVLDLARYYGKDRKQIYRWLELHSLDPRDFRR
jgi:two-component system C4-dicarboxylate transport response regulator DctD